MNFATDTKSQLSTDSCIVEMTRARWKSIYEHVTPEIIVLLLSESIKSSLSQAFNTEIKVQPDTLSGSHLILCYYQAMIPFESEEIIRSVNWCLLINVFAFFLYNMTTSSRFKRGFYSVTKRKPVRIAVAYVVSLVIGILLLKKLSQQGRLVKVYSVNLKCI